MAKYCYIGCHVLWREVCHFISTSNNHFDIQLLDWGLHTHPDDLCSTLQKAVNNLTKKYDAVLIGYGLCSNGIKGIKSGRNKLVLMRGHDCITFLMGSKKKYREYFDKHPGTYWYSPGWIEDHLEPGKDRYEKTRMEYVEKFGEGNADYLMEVEQDWFRKYTYATYVDLNIGNNGHFKKYTKECAEWLNWNYQEIKGDPDLLVNFINGIWDDERYLVVEPGFIIQPSYDESIIKAVKISDNDNEVE